MCDVCPGGRCVTSCVVYCTSHTFSQGGSVCNAFCTRLHGWDLYDDTSGLRTRLPGRGLPPGMALAHTIVGQDLYDLHDIDHAAWWEPYDALNSSCAHVCFGGICRDDYCTHIRRVGFILSA